MQNKFSPAFIVLLLASAQSALLVPYVVLVPGERTNLFTPVLLLVPALLYAWQARRSARVAAWGPWLLLGAGLTAVSLASPEPMVALYRAAAFFIPAVAGVLCGKELAADARGLELFLGLLSACFAALTFAGLAFGEPPFFLDLHHHALTGILVLLSAGPIYLVRTRTGAARWAALVLLLLGGILCFRAGSRFLVLLPLVLLPLMLLMGRLRLAMALPWIACATALAALFFFIYPEKTLRLSNYESTFYRLEGIPASFALIGAHPLTGIGIRTPRDELLADYSTKLGIVDSITFLRVVKRNVTFDNQYLSLPVGVGLPLASLYFLLVGRLLWLYHRRGVRAGGGGAVARSIMFPLLSTVVHLLFYDGLFYPNISWFFHLFAGLGAVIVLNAVSAEDVRQTVTL